LQELFKKEEDGSASLYEKIVAVYEFYKRCSTSNWESYKNKGIVPHCFWENGTANTAFQSGVIDGVYGEVKGIVDLIGDAEKHLISVAGILLQISVAISSEKYGCLDEDLMCNYAALVERMKQEIACELTCDEAAMANNQLFEYENIIKGCQLEDKLKEGINNIYDFIENEQKMQELMATIETKLGGLMDKINAGDKVVAYQMGKVLGVIGFNFIPVSAVAKSERVKDILTKLKNLSSTKLKALIAYLDNVLRGTIKLPDDIKYGFDGDDILIFKGDCPLSNLNSEEATSRSLCRAIARVDKEGDFRIQNLDEFTGVAIAYPEGLKTLDELALVPGGNHFSAADVQNSAMKLDLTDPKIKDTPTVSGASGETLDDLIKRFDKDGDGDGEIAEEVARLMFARNDYTYHPGKYGGNNGFDGVFIKTKNGCNPSNPACEIVDIIITESKPFVGGIHLNAANGNTQLPAQMSSAWITYVINNIQRLPNAPVASKNTATILNRYLSNPNNEIHKFVTAIDKSNGPADNFGTKSFRFNIVNFGTHP